MADVRAFRGIIYNQEKTPDLTAVTAPPYDVISPTQREEFEERHANNVVRLILSQEKVADSETDNKYTRANETLNLWMKENILVEDKEESFYVYEQQFQSNGQIYKRVGFITRIKIEDFSSKVILPHEKTFKGPRTDRQNLLRTTKTNFSQIFALFPDHENKVDSILSTLTVEKPLFVLPDVDGIAHRVWRLSDSDKINSIRENLKDSEIFIADGHHRYESSLNYRDEMRSQNPNYTGEEPYNFTMMMLVSMSNPGLIILPTHRIINGVKKFTTTSFIETVKPYFDVEVIDFTPENKMNKLQGIEDKISQLTDKHHVFCLYTGNEFVFLKLLDEAAVIKNIDETRTNDWKKLDVTILHHFIMKILMDYVPAPEQIKYSPDGTTLVNKVDEGDFQLGFLVAPTKIEQVRQIASLYEIMPQKSTYFYPKILTGLVINKH